jgi:hypothetical protein
VSTFEDLFAAAMKEAAKLDEERKQRGEPPSKYPLEQRAEALAKMELLKQNEAEKKPRRKSSGGGRLTKKFVGSHAVPAVTTEEARERKLFGPVWHGSSDAGREKIAREGFKVIIGTSRTDDTEHGYPYQPYTRGGKTPAPIHHLGFGVYFTTSKTIAKHFNNESMTGLVTYYLDIPRLETINFASANNMMKWWIAQGYDAALAESGLDGWMKATKQLTANLASKWDAVWFKGKLLDGDQVCVFDPKRIYRLDDSKVGGLSIGAKVRRKSDGMVGKIVDKRMLAEHQRQFHGGSSFFAKVKWKVGGVDWNVREQDIEPIS